MTLRAQSIAWALAVKMDVSFGRDFLSSFLLHMAAYTVLPIILYIYERVDIFRKSIRKSIFVTLSHLSSELCIPS